MTERPLNIIIVGITGGGKSSTGNFIVGMKVFDSKAGFKSTTKEISDVKTVQDGRTIKVVDTPGFFDTDENLFETALKIQTSLKEVSPGPHAFLIVIDGSRKYTEEEKKTQLLIQLTFGEKILKHALIILTHEDVFDSSEDLLRQAESVKELQTLIKLCGGRCITLNSLCTDRNYSTGKIKKIINEVNAISKNGKDCYIEDLTAYTQALKEHANKKTANEDLTAGLLATYLKNADAKAKRKAKAAYKEGKASGIYTAKIQVEAAHEEREASRKKAYAEGVCMATVGMIGLGGMIIARNPATLVNVLVGVGIGATLLKEKRKRDDQDMDPSGIDWESPQFQGI